MTVNKARQTGLAVMSVTASQRYLPWYCFLLSNSVFGRQHDVVCQTVCCETRLLNHFDTVSFARHHCSTVCVCVCVCVCVSRLLY